MNPWRRMALAIGAGLAAQSALLRAQSSTVAIRRVGVLTLSTNRLGFLVPTAIRDAKLLADALAPMVSALSLEVVFAEAANPAEFDAAVGRLIGERVDAIFAASDLAFNLRARLIELASRNRIPVVGTRAQWVDAGAPLSYGPSQSGQLRRSAQLLDKVLKGTKPADIPVEQPTEFELAVNLRIAKSFGITVPYSMLLRTNRVIE